MCEKKGALCKLIRMGQHLGVRQQVGVRQQQVRQRSGLVRQAGWWDHVSEHRGKPTRRLGSLRGFHIASKLQGRLWIGSGWGCSLRFSRRVVYQRDLLRGGVGVLQLLKRGEFTF